MVAPAGPRVALVVLAMAMAVCATTVAAQQPAEPIAEPDTRITAAEKDAEGSTQASQRGSYDEDRYYYNPHWRNHHRDDYHLETCRNAGQHCGHDYDAHCCHGLICSHGRPRAPSDAATARGYRSSQGLPVCWRPCPATPPGASPPGPNANPWACTGMWLGSTCTATCTGSGTSYQAVCSVRGEWIVTPGACDCGPPPSPPNQYTNNFTCSSGTLEGTNCTATCGPNVGRGPGYTTVCQANGTWSTPTGLCYDGASCFSGDSKVVVRRSPEPIAMRDLQIGDDVLCVAAPDLLTPGATRFCPVRSFARSEERAFEDMTRLDYTVLGSGGALRGSITMSNLHMLHVLTGDAADLAVMPAAATVDQLGAFDLIAAVHAQPGQHIPVAAPGSAGGFVTAVIDAAKPVVADGKYLPALEEPYIVVDSVVVPLWSTWARLQRFADAPEHPARLGAHRLANALKHMFYAPLWMATSHAQGTPGRDVDWDGSDRAPLSLALEASFKTLSGTANFTAAAEWFAPRVAAWRLARAAAGAEGQEAAITAADVLAAWPTMFGAEPAPAVAAAEAQVPAASAVTCQMTHCS